MPNRIIREGILTSDKVNELSPEAEVFYRRLLSKVDDHGTFDGRPAVLRASLYPLRLDTVSADKCLQLLAECCDAELVVAYENDGKPYIQALNTQWVARSAPKNPLPDDPASNCAQLKTSARLDVDVVVGVDVVVDGANKSPTTPKKSPKRAEQTFADWNASLDGDAIPATDPVFAYAAKAGLPPDYVALAWAWFDAEYGEGGPRQTKRYADWRAVFRKAVAGNWGKLWAVNRQGEFYLTTEGVQAQRALA